MRVCKEGGVCRKVPTKSLFEQEAPQNWNPKVFDQTRCSRTFARRICPENHRELVKADVFEKRVFEPTTPLR